MAFEDTETGDTSANPIELYIFTGTFKTWYVTTHGREVMNGLGVFEPIPISRSELKNMSQEQDDMMLEIALPFDHEIAEDYVFDTSPPSLTLEIYRVHTNALEDYELIWTGIPLSFTAEGDMIKLKVPSILSHLLSGVCPKTKYQAPCNHVLYDERCKVKREDNSATVTITAIGPDLMFLEVDGQPFDSGDCKAGEMLWEDGGQRRMIINNNASQNFKIASPFSGLQVGDTVEVTRGCKHSFSVCIEKFDNAINFGGFPLIPNSNPFKSRL